MNVSYEYPYFLWNGQPFIPRIFDAGPSEVSPEGFTSVRIPIDGRIHSDLLWSTAIEQAKNAVASHRTILWDLDLGLFSRLRLPLSDEMQFRALQLSVNRLLDMIHAQYLGSSLGVVLYRGNLDFSHSFPWEWESRDASRGLSDRDTRLFCRDLCLRYLRQLTQGWPDAIQPFLLLDATRIRSPLERLLLTHRDLFAGFACVVRGETGLDRWLGWESGSAYGSLSRRPIEPVKELDTKIGLCLPSRNLGDASFQALESVLKRAPVRVLTEEYLTVDWDGLDVIVLSVEGLGSAGLRKLQGFCAAGGSVVPLGGTLNLPQEVDLEGVFI